MVNMKHLGLLIAMIALLTIAACTNAATYTNTGTPQNTVTPPTTGATDTGNPSNTGTPAATDAGTPSNTVTPPATGTSDTGASAKIKLTDSQYANNAYLISGDTLDSAAQAATSGFTITKTPNADGTTTIALSSTNPEYKNQSYTLQTGQQLYFIERILGDDSNNQELNLGDDTAIIVDADGYIVQ